MIPTETRDLAVRLLAREAGAGPACQFIEADAVRVYEKLRGSLSAVAGVAGFQVLASRALVLAKADAPGLNAAQVAVDGKLQGMDANQAGEAGVVLIARILGLLLMLLGQALTLQLLRDAWPGAAFDDGHSLDNPGDRKKA
jgi:hypothetical protein